MSHAIATLPLTEFKPLSFPRALLLGIITCIAYWFAFSTPMGAAAILIALPCLCLFGRLRTSRQAFYGGMILGMGMYVPHLLFFKDIFHFAAIPLWLVAGLPVAIFLLLLQQAHKRFGPMWAMWLTPVLWAGLEYFRSEAWQLRFAWLLPGQAAAFVPGVRLLWVGVYGLGFAYILVAAMSVGPRLVFRVLGLVALACFAIVMYVPKLPPTPAAGLLHVAGVQLESPDERKAAAAIDRLAIDHPEAQILVLSEYTFFGPVPPAVRKVVKKHHRYLIAGGTQAVSDDQYYNTAIVVGPDGKDVFNQAKSVPVQFMSDGLPAQQRRVWESPWGKIGIAVCYDLSYANVMDDFVRQGAQGLIIPTMDLASWGGYERRMLHGRMAPVRSAEYAIPTFGVWSSGESQLTDRFGRIIARGAYPGQGDTIAGPFNLDGRGHVPPDRFLAMGTMWVTGGFVLLLIALHLRGFLRQRG